MLPQIASWHVLGRSCHQDCFWHNTGCYIDCFCKSDQLVHMLSALDSLLGTSLVLQFLTTCTKQSWSGDSNGKAVLFLLVFQAYSYRRPRLYVDVNCTASFMEQGKWYYEPFASRATQSLVSVT